MYEGQQIVEAIFRQKPSPRGIRRKIGNIDFDETGAFHFVGNPDSYEGVRGFLSFQGVEPDVDPLAAAVIIPADLKNGTSGGEGGTGKVRPPSETFSDLDNVSGFVNEVRTNGQAGSSEPPVQATVGPETGLGSGASAAADSAGNVAGSTDATTGTEGSDPGGNGLGSEDQVGDFDAPPSDDDFDFS